MVYAVAVPAADGIEAGIEGIGGLAAVGDGYAWG